MSEYDPDIQSQEPKAEAPPPPQIKTPEADPLVTYTLMGLSILFFLLQVGSSVVLDQDLIGDFGVKSNRLIKAGEFWRLLTPMLLHGSILHLGFNMYALYILGRRLEQYFGHARFLTLYIISGYSGNILSFTLTQADSLGSSTAIFGLLGAEGVFLYQHRDMLGERFRGALGQIIQVAVINLIIGLSPGIDNWGHMGGLVGGVVFTWFAGPTFRVEGLSPFLELVDTRAENVAWTVFLLMALALSGLVWLILNLRAGGGL